MVLCGDSWAMWRTLPDGYKQRKWEVDLITSVFLVGTTSRRSALEKDEHSAMSAFLMHKTDRGVPLKRLWKGFQCTSHPASAPWDMASLLLGLKCLIKHLSLGNYSRVWELQRAENSETEGGKHRHRTFSLLIKLHPGSWRCCWQCTRCFQGDWHFYLHY